jgi:bifunctional DNA-binding transcriptional regulator/antitoxin component of YhaV-PrlF toxin-antitoxin module
MKITLTEKQVLPATITVNQRGTLTLPKHLRHVLGMDRGGVLMAGPAEHGGIVLRAAVAFPVEMYSDRRIAEFDQADAALGRRLAAKPRRTAR